MKGGFRSVSCRPTRAEARTAAPLYLGGHRLRIDGGAAFRGGASAAGAAGGGRWRCAPPGAPAPLSPAAVVSWNNVIFFLSVFFFYE